MQVKEVMLTQMQVKEKQRQEAYEQYLRERQQVDLHVQQMVNEDL